MISHRKRLWSIVLWLVALSCLLPFVTLSFFSAPLSDDYGLFLRYRQNGFWETQHLIYTQWTGRYMSTFIGSLFFIPGMPDRYYFLHSLLLLTATWGSLYFFLSMINRRWLGNAFPKLRLALASLVLMLLTIYVQAEVSTGLYWLSSAVTYQTAFVFFILLAGCLVRRVSPGGRGSRDVRAPGPIRNDILISILILCIVGSNETAAVYLFFFFLGLAGLFYYYERKVPMTIRIYVGVTLATGVLVLLSSGILSYRSSMIHYHPRGLAVILPMILYRFVSVFFFVWKVPLFWLVAGVLYMLGRWSRPRLPIGGSEMIAAVQGKTILLPGLIAIGATILLSLTAILVVSKGSLPDRALNNLVDLTTILLLVLVFLAGLAGPAVNPQPAGMAPPSTISVPTVTILLVCGLLGSECLLQACKSNFSGYFYHSVIEDRHLTMQKASEAGQKTVTLYGYGRALEDKIRKDFPGGMFRSIDPVLREKPSLLYLGDGPEGVDPGWKYYYNLDSIRVN